MDSASWGCKESSLSILHWSLSSGFSNPPDRGLLLPSAGLHSLWGTVFLLYFPGWGTQILTPARIREATVVFKQRYGMLLLHSVRISPGVQLGWEWRQETYIERTEESEQTGNRGGQPQQGPFYTAEPWLYMYTAVLVDTSVSRHRWWLVVF